MSTAVLHIYISNTNISNTSKIRLILFAQCEHLNYSLRYVIKRAVTKNKF